MVMNNLNVLCVSYYKCLMKVKTRYVRILPVFSHHSKHLQ